MKIKYDKILENIRRMEPVEGSRSAEQIYTRLSRDFNGIISAAESPDSQNLNVFA